MSEFEIFSFFIIIGVVISFVFDFFKALRKEIKHKDNIVFIEDIIYLIFVGILIFLGIYKINEGVVRFYLFFAIFVRNSWIFFDNK